MTVPAAADLARAYAATRVATRRTPLLESAALARMSGAARVFVKAESLQLAGSFKIRGAYWRLLQLDPGERAKGVVAYSSGNFAQGLAAAGAMLGVPVTIVMPADAPEAKRRATEGHGARVILSHHGDRPREEAAADLACATAAEAGLVLLHPFDDPAIVAGQAGAGLEALE
ncbi:MAG: pyridoxal-phosphate dependent enzyme, partial [Rhodobacteraceae bacterium]|nr:pyridoxal-phosphate dependent enzyme [Paracoccaceae bacterium]